MPFSKVLGLNKKTLQKLKTLKHAVNKKLKKRFYVDDTCWMRLYRTDGGVLRGTNMSSNKPPVDNR